MCAKFDDRAVEMVRLPYHETRRDTAGCTSEAERIGRGTMRRTSREISAGT
jgi:hypothetical protein